METLPSGLPNEISDGEDLARFLYSSSQYNSIIVKPSAFLPGIGDRETSVFRHGKDPADNLWRLAGEHAPPGRTTHGVAILKALHVRNALLAVFATEPPPRHASIRNWPWIESDEALQKARQKELAGMLASNAELIKK
jgi:hypothetical protein